MIDLGDDGVWECGSTSSEESVAPPPPPPLLLCTCGVRLPGAEMSQHLLSDWHRFNLKRKTASPRLRRKPVTLEAYEQWAAKPRQWHSKTGRIRKQATSAPLPSLSSPRASTAASTASTAATAAAAAAATAAAAAAAAAAPLCVHRQLSWASATDVLEEVLCVAELDPLCRAAAVCTAWRVVLTRVREERWRALRAQRPSELPPRAPIEALDRALRDEVARIVSSFGTITDHSSAAAQQRSPTALPTCELSRMGAAWEPHGRLGSPEFPPSFDFGAAMELLQRGASTRAIVPHAAYGPDGVGFGGVARLCVDMATGATLKPVSRRFA